MSGVGRRIKIYTQSQNLAGKEGWLFFFQSCKNKNPAREDRARYAETLEVLPLSNENPTTGISLSE